jgi:hypothetical protein
MDNGVARGSTSRRHGDGLRYLLEFLHDRRVLRVGGDAIERDVVEPFSHEQIEERLEDSRATCEARVQTAATPGEILVSETVKAIAIGSGIRFEDRG